MKTIIVEKPKKILQCIAGSRYCMNNAFDLIHICTNCEKAYLINSEQVKKFACKQCQETETIEIYRSITSDCYNSIAYSYITEFSYDEEYLKINFNIVNFNIFIEENNEENELKYSVDEKAAYFVIQKEKLYKTKDDVAYKSSLYIDDKKQKITKAILREYFDFLLNIDELMKEGICITSKNGADILWNLNKYAKNYNVCMKYGLMPIKDKEMDVLQPIINNMDKSDFYKKKIQEFIKQQIGKALDSVYSLSIYAREITSRFISTEERYYELLDYISNSTQYYIIYQNLYNIRPLALFFTEEKFTDEEVDEFFLAAYRQAYRLIRSNIQDSTNVYRKLNMPTERIPKEMYKYELRATTLQHYYNGNNIKELNIKYGENKFKIKLINKIEQLKLMFEKYKNIKLINKLLYENYKSEIYPISENMYIVGSHAIYMDALGKYAIETIELDNIYKIVIENKEIEDKDEILKIIKEVGEKYE